MHTAPTTITFHRADPNVLALRRSAGASRMASSQVTALRMALTQGHWRRPSPRPGTTRHARRRRIPLRTLHRRDRAAALVPCLRKTSRRHRHLRAHGAAGPRDRPACRIRHLSGPHRRVRRRPDRVRPRARGLRQRRLRRRPTPHRRDHPARRHRRGPSSDRPRRARPRHRGPRPGRRRALAPPHRTAPPHPRTPTQRRPDEPHPPDPPTTTPPAPTREEHPR